MYIAHELGWAYFAMPRCASTSVARWFSINYQALRQGAHHALKGRGDLGLQVFTTVRNPYERALSKWCSARMAPRSQQGEGIAAFQQWLSRACELPFGKNSDCLPRPMLEWVEDLGSNRVICVHVERLANDLAALPFVVNGRIGTLHQLNQSHHRPWRDYYTPALYRDVAQKYDVDFNHFAYPVC